jgi:hypothetical protein
MSRLLHDIWSRRRCDVKGLSAYILQVCCPFEENVNLENSI